MSRRRNPGAGTAPAPRGITEDTAAALVAQLRDAAREAREALADLQRERKAIEQAARERAEQVIETHVNSMIAQLTVHVDTENVRISKQLTEYHRAHLDHLITQWTGLVNVEDLVGAVHTLNELRRLALEEQARHEEGTDG